ncbi:hypothetical protein [Kribbella jiaozuonensis]|uniref:PknH-like extracellular domain-containing protein n=1 Tax=Kribbella jiaozuonensis TaxID=2575441 RepID=A0A4U3LTD2_9ACTN|nr:hypothetical protein [Kribbella jiaozuonensis]TKK78424.1 hypothetical protein FDA38_25505 [Kribbella jiaozuonensis]
MKVAGGKLRGMLAAGAAVGAMAAGIGVLGMGGADAATSSTAATTALSRSQLLTVGEVKKADARRNWFRQVDRGILPRTYCGPASTEGKHVSARMARGFTDEMDAYGAQYVSQYANAAAAKAAYNSIIATLKSCTYSKPAPTHARKITENRVVKGASGDLTQVIRWYDYPKPNDPGSEAGGFPYAVTLKGRNVSVLAFSEMGPGVPAPNFDKLARQAAAKVTR